MRSFAGCEYLVFTKILQITLQLRINAQMCIREAILILSGRALLFY